MGDTNVPVKCVLLKQNDQSDVIEIFFGVSIVEFEQMSAGMFEWFTNNIVLVIPVNFSP